MDEYMRRINKALSRGIIDQGSAAVAEVRHDDKGKNRCGVYTGGECNCDPDILIKTNKSVLRVNADGTVSKLH